MSAVRLLDRLELVRETTPGRWRARCPAHQGKSQSLSIAEVDGRVLVKCFGGCETAAVLAAAGLGFSDLFERPLGEHGPVRRSPWSARDVLALVLREAQVVALVGSDLVERRSITDADWQRMAQAVARLSTIAAEVRE